MGTPLRACLACFLSKFKPQLATDRRIEIDRGRALKDTKRYGELTTEVLLQPSLKLDNLDKRKLHLNEIRALSYPLLFTTTVYLVLVLCESPQRSIPYMVEQDEEKEGF